MAHLTSEGEEGWLTWRMKVRKDGSPEEWRWGRKRSLTASKIIHIALISLFSWAPKAYGSFGLGTTLSTISQRSCSLVTLAFQDRKLDTPSNMFSTLRHVDAILRSDDLPWNQPYYRNYTCTNPYAPCKTVTRICTLPIFIWPAYVCDLPHFSPRTPCKARFFSCTTVSWEICPSISVC